MGVGMRNRSSTVPDISLIPDEERPYLEEVTTRPRIQHSETSALGAQTVMRTVISDPPCIERINTRCSERSCCGGETSTPEWPTCSCANPGDKSDGMAKATLAKFMEESRIDLPHRAMPKLIAYLGEELAKTAQEQSICKISLWSSFQKKIDGVVPWILAQMGETAICSGSARGIVPGYGELLPRTSRIAFASTAVGHPHWIIGSQTSRNINSRTKKSNGQNVRNNIFGEFIRNTQCWRYRERRITGR